MFTIKNITQAEVQHLIQRLKDGSNRINQSFGSPNFIAQGFGLAISCSFSVDKRELSVTVAHKPIFTNDRLIEEGMLEVLESYRSIGISSIRTIDKKS